MKKVLLTIALALAVGSLSAQTADDKAKAKAEAAALKAAQKEAKAQVKEAQQIWDALNLQIQEKKSTAEGTLDECKKGQEILQKALHSGMIDE